MPPDPLADALDRLHRDAGLKRLSPVWAKLEIALGLLANGGGLFLGLWLAAAPADRTPDRWALALGLYAFGGYLALAGHRSHLYQSNNRLAAYLADTIRAHPGDRP